MDKKTRRLYDGVIYTPGRRSPAKRRSARRKTKSHFPFLYGLTLFTGIIACIVVFVTMFNSFIDSRDAATPAPAQSTPARSTPTAVAYEQTSDAVGVIKNISGGTDRFLAIYDIAGARTLNLLTDGTTDFKNRYGQAIVYAELAVGDIVEFTYEPRGNLLKSLRHSGQAWELKQVSKVSVDYAARTVSVNNDVYAYNDELISVAKGAGFDIRDIQPIDVVTLKGYQDKLWYAELIKSHGFLEFTDARLVVDGILEINTDFAADLSDAGTIELLEGVHRVVVRGGNIETYLKEIFIEKGETYVLDLNDVQFRMGLINLTVNTGDYTCHIDGEEVVPGEPILLTYGSYAFKLSKEGYLPWDGQVAVNEPVVELAVELKEEVQQSRFTINSYPAGAEIYIDNSYVGVAPLTISVDYGRHSIIARIPGYKSIDFERLIEKPADAIDIFMQEEEPVMPTGG